MKKYIYIILFTLISVNAQAQFPDLFLKIDSITTNTGQTVNLVVRADSNFQNITNIKGTIVWDTNVIQYNSISSFGINAGMNAMNMSHFDESQVSSGKLGFNYSSFITIGPTLAKGDEFFTINFDVTGAAGTQSVVSLSSDMNSLSWNNGFGWNGLVRGYSGLVEITSTTSVIEGKKSAFSAFPNPASDKIVISDIQNITDIKVLNLIGKEMPIKRFQNTVKFMFKQPGVYFLQVTANGTKSLKRIVITK